MPGSGTAAMLAGVAASGRGRVEERRGTLANGQARPVGQGVEVRHVQRAGRRRRAARVTVRAAEDSVPRVAQAERLASPVSLMLPEIVNSVPEMGATSAAARQDQGGRNRVRAAEHRDRDPGRSAQGQRAAVARRQRVAVAAGEDQGPGRLRAVERDRDGQCHLGEVTVPLLGGVGADDQLPAMAQLPPPAWVQLPPLVTSGTRSSCVGLYCNW